MELTNSEDGFSFCDSDVESGNEALDEIEEWTSPDTEVQALLEFSKKISRQIVSYFQRNSRKEDNCDVYEDKFSAPPSGSHSYYRDLLAMAQMNDHSMEATRQSTPSGSNCAWPCTGHRNASLGVGPLEDLFRVLEPSPRDMHETTPPRNVRTISKDGTSKDHNDDNPSNLNVEVCSTIMDALNKWNNDSFTQHLSDAVEELQTFEGDIFINS